ncbi:MAG: lipoate--protein ligase family protein [Spirulinaceae cyanobacterium]
MFVTSWRLIPLLEAPGAVQMAIDAWLWRSHQQGNHPPTLRFCTWQPVAISLGVSQRRNIPDHWRSLTWRGQPVDLVKRPSGGRGVLHQGELTYAIVTNAPPGNREQSYRALCEFLIQGWAELGVALRFGGRDCAKRSAPGDCAQRSAPGDRAYIKSPNCFGLSTRADLVDVQGRKRIGSAQRRQGQTVLQHGSMLLNPDPALFTEVFGQAPPNILVSTPIPQITTALTRAAATCFVAEFVEQPLTPQEWAEIKALQGEFVG